jgi:hypothetical protein
MNKRINLNYAIMPTTVKIIIFQFYELVNTLKEKNHLNLKLIENLIDFFLLTC